MLGFAAIFLDLCQLDEIFPLAPERPVETLLHG